MTDCKSFLLKSSVFSLIWVLGLGSSLLSQGIHKDSSSIHSWANVCVVERGYINIADTSAIDNNSKRPTMGVEKDATGMADGRVISLGDGGRATYILENPLRDITGPDFAVFENGFREQTPPQLWFLELAFVEVSSDGSNFVRFPSESDTQTTVQVNTFGQLDTAAVHNLAGKYATFYGTPFDLADLSDSSNVDIQNITHIRIIDVVGSINPDYGSRDAAGNLINDPFPTPFWVGGFDLDALALLAETTSDDFRFSIFDFRVTVFPNPVNAGQPFSLQVEGKKAYDVLEIINSKGQIIRKQFKNQKSQVIIKKPGLYYLRFSLGDQVIIRKILVN